MGKAKRFNSYDGVVSEQRKIAEQFGRDRQNLSGIGSSFRSPPLQPPTARQSAGGGTTGTGSGTFLTASLAADQTTNLGANDHVEFDTKDEDGGIILQTGAGQLDGIFELSGGKKYELSAMLRPEFSGATGQLVVVWYDITNAAEIGSRAIYEAQTNTSNNANQPVAETIVTPAANITAELRIISVTALTALANEYCIANLFEIALGGTSTSGGTGNNIIISDVLTTTNPSGSINVDVSAHQHFVFELNANITITFTGLHPVNETSEQIVMEFIQDATGGRTVGYSHTINPSVPAISTAADIREVVTGFIRRDAVGVYVFNLYLVGN